ncbi:hypothetical protein BC937DRAFT_95571 [Endogone sp. FLAS-F59071]|nr:hypothetical protein BC937DRAFT_95571 [Endogone sp. FLAS-F59071]|eukprot:RUS20269.1 hypothetical protein BC937DRAFT_95571 [Endogone sp. FLAS-F59071]
MSAKIAAAPTASRSLLTLYLSALSTNPLRTKAATSGILAGLQELVAQRLAGQKSKNGEIIDLKVIQMTAYGLFISGPLGHFLFELLQKAFKGQTGRKAQIGQILASNLIISPIQNAVYLAVMSMIAGARTSKQVMNAVRLGLFPMMKVSWVVSPIAMTFAQNFLPVTLWVPFFNIVSFIFGTYINTVTKRKRIQQERKQD